MKFKAVLTTETELEPAADALCAGVEGVAPDLAMLFMTHHHEDHMERLLPLIQARINARNLLGCAGEGIIGPDREIEQLPAAALWVAELPGVRVLPFILDFSDMQALDSTEAWRDRIGVSPDDHPSFILIPDPFTVPTDDLLRRLDDAFPGAPIAGGMASGAEQAGQTRLFLNGQVLRQGAVGVSLAGDLEITTIVSQGCRPIGKPYVITDCQANLITGLGGHSAYGVLKEVFSQASAEEQSLMQSGVHVGRVVNETLTHFSQGDFLVRNVLGVVADKAIAIGDQMRRGQTIQFHIRDAKTAEQDLKMLIQARVVDAGLHPTGGLLFTCNGRGTRLFEVRNHDIQLINGLLADCTVAGFFAAGEIGPVGNTTFVHGYTSSLVLFSAARS